MDFDYNNNVNLTKEKDDVIKEQFTLRYEDNEAYICTKERQYDDIDDNVTTIKQNCKIVIGDLNMNIVTQPQKEKIKAEKLAEKEKIKVEKLAEKEKIKVEKLAEKEKMMVDKKAEKEKMMVDKKAEKEKIKADKKAEKERVKTNKVVGIKKNKKSENINQHKQCVNDVKVKGRPRIEYNVKIVTGINDDEQQDYNFLEVEEYCTEVTIDGVIYYQDRNLVLYDYESHEEI
jgi:hypothetical protein